MTALIRTVVPLAWGWLITTLIGWGVITPEIAEVLQGWTAGIVAGVTLVVGVAVYQAANWLLRQSWFPTWLAKLFAGSVKQPVYPEG